MTLIRNPFNLFCCNKVSNLEFPHRKDPNNSLRDTLLDGEMIVDIVDGQKVPRYLIYDIVKYAVRQWFLNFFVCFTLLTKMIIRFTPNM